MPIYRPDISTEVLRWARQRAGLNFEDFSGKLSNYELWEQGEAKPTFRQLEAIASKTRTPLGYFFLSEPPTDDLPIPDFRRMDENMVERPSADLLETIYILLRRQNWLRDYLKDQGMSPLPFVGSAKVEDSPTKVAQSIQSTLGISSNWAIELAKTKDPRRVLKDAAESRGISVTINGVVGNNTHRKLDPQEFRGFVLSDFYAPIIFVNGSDAKSAQVFTIAHELCHVWINQDGIPDINFVRATESRVEQFCNEVAAEFTVPEVILKSVWNQSKHADSPFEQLAKNFKVSPIVIARRALDTRLISRESFFSFYDNYQEKLKRFEPENDSSGSSGGDFGDGPSPYVNQGYRVGDAFFSRVADAVKAGQLLYRDAYRLTDLKSGSFEEYANRLGYGL